MHLPPRCSRCAPDSPPLPISPWHALPSSPSLDAWQFLGAEEGFFAALVPSVVASLGEAFPELVTQQGHVMSVLREEEDAFSSMLSRGIKEFNARAETIKGQARRHVT